MKKNRFLPLTTAGMIAASIFSAGMVGAEGNVADENLVKMNEIKTIVSNFTYTEDLIPDVDKNDLTNFQDVMDFNGEVIGHAFEINKDQQDYFVFASNNYELDPIISYGEGKFYAGEDNDSTEENLYFDGAFRIENQEAYEELVSPETSDLNNSTTLAKNSNNKKADYNFFRYDSSKKAEWNQLKKYRKNEKIVNFPSAVPNYWELYTPRFYQRTSGIGMNWSACGPTTGAMFANYLKSTKGYDVQGLSSYSSSVAKLVNHMGFEMQTSALGTSPRMFADGLNEHLEHNYGFFHDAWSITIDKAYGRYDEFKKEIGVYKFPVALYASNHSDPEAKALDYHFVLGVGYEHTPYGAYFAIKDPDHGADNKDNRWYKWNTYNDYLTMIRANYNSR